MDPRTNGVKRATGRWSRVALSMLAWLAVALFGLVWTSLP